MRLWGLASLKSAEQAVGWRPREKQMLPLEPEGGLEAECILRGTSLFSLKTSNCWMRTHIIESNLLYSKSTDFNINLRHIFTATSKLMSDQKLGTTA